MRKTRIILYSLLILVTIQLYSQVPTWNWAEDIHTNQDEVANDVALDSSDGSCYVVGQWEDDLSAIFPAGVLPSEDFSSLYGGNSDGFVAKYDNTGTLLWAFKIGCNKNDNISAIAVDPSGNFYITGTFEENTAEFTGTGALTATTSLTNADNDYDFFVAKYNSDGELLWVKQGFVPTGRDMSGTAISAYANGVFVSGYYNDDATFGAFTVPDDGLYNQGFLVSYDVNGNEQWVAHGASDNKDYTTRSYFNGIITDGTDVIVSGNFKGSDIDIYNTVDAIVANEANSQEGTAELILVSFTVGGVFNWSQSIGGNNDEEERSIAIDGSTFYLTGGIGNNASFPG
ncbi:MAG: hypothetical protein MI922_17160, partial [Bacteroidales bacterium]|nr:hypothetical protein [Bacteroidales bacterium]